jgi:Brp/Blh family beta-carotene 15,15'-monooxygenase
MEQAEHTFGRVFLFATAALIAAAAFGLRFNDSATLVVLVLGVVLLGLPHGALDPLVAGKAFGSSASYSSVVFYTVYLFLVCCYAWLWIQLPTLGLAGFLLIAAFHFGSDWAPRGVALTRLGYGLTVVTLPAVLHSANEARIFALLGTQHAQAFVAVSCWLAPVAVLAGGVGGLLQFKQHRRDLVEFLAIVAGALLLEPLVFFTCYFSLLHSPRHLLETAQDLGLTNFRSIAKSSLPILAATLALAALFYLQLRGAPISGRIVRTVFIGLAALTVPHMLLDTLASEMRERNGGRIETAPADPCQ